jgi:hypothetical protein
MAFNFMAALGGFGSQVSANIESQKEFQREKEFKLELLAEEEATKMRLARAGERKAQREKDKAMAGKLKALGFSDDRVAFAMGQGTGYAEGIADIASAAMAKGKNPNTLLTYSDSMDQFKKLSGTERDGVRVGKVDTTKIPEGFDYSTAFKQDLDLTTSVLKEKDDDAREFNNLDELYTYFKNEQFQYDADSVEWKAIDSKLENIRTDMHEIAKEKDTSTPTDPTPVDLISQNQFNNDMKSNRIGVAGKYNLKTLEGEFQDVEEGQQLDSQIAELDAALRTKESYNALEGESTLKQQGTSRVNATINSSVSSMGVLAKQVYAASVTNPTEGLGAKWKMPEGQNNFDLKKMLQSAKSGNTTDLMTFTNYVDSLDYGDVIQVDGHLAVFTGFTQTYNNLKDHTGNVLAMPLLFVGNLPDNYIYSNISNQ